MRKEKRAKKNILPKSAVAALLAAVIIFCIMLNVEKNAMAAYEKGEILVASKDIEAGVVLNKENFGTYLE